MVMDYSAAMSQDMLTFEEEVELIRRWQQGRDEKALDRLVRTHMRLCYSEARRYARGEAQIEDLAQEGIFGLRKAADKFDPSFNNRFASYAKLWVKTEVQKNVAAVSVVVDIPYRKYLDARGARGDEGADWQAHQAARGEVALDAPVGEGEETAAGDLLPCNKPGPEAQAIENDKLALYRRVVAEALEGAMNDREAEVLRRRLLQVKPETLEDIAKGFGVSRERVRQIEAAAIDKLRRYLVNTGFPVGVLRG